jgi:hypothetical protein
MDTLADRFLNDWAACLWSCHHRLVTMKAAPTPRANNSTNDNSPTIYVITPSRLKAHVGQMLRKEMWHHPYQ